MISCFHICCLFLTYLLSYELFDVYDILTYFNFSGIVYLNDCYVLLLKLNYTCIIR